MLQSQFQEVIHVFKGSRFVNTHPEEITILAKALYLALTTLFGARTLGEEYVDLIYVTRKGGRLPGVFKKLGFIASYAILPYILNKIVKRFVPQDVDEKPKNKFASFLASYPKVLDTLMNLHVALFYFHGQFYLISKRVFGLRYAFGHNKDALKLENSLNNYSILGLIIFLQYSVKALLLIKENGDEKRRKQKLDEEKDQEARELAERGEVARKEAKFALINMVQKIETEKYTTDLSDPKCLEYIPENSRACMLCLLTMVNPSAALCGHIFDWECIVDWVREHPECPLCRQGCMEKDLIPLR